MSLTRQQPGIFRWIFGMLGAVFIIVVTTTLLLTGYEITRLSAYYQLRTAINDKNSRYFDRAARYFASSDPLLLVESYLGIPPYFNFESQPSDIGSKDILKLSGLLLQRRFKGAKDVAEIAIVKNKVPKESAFFTLMAASIDDFIKNSNEVSRLKRTKTALEKHHQQLLAQHRLIAESMAEYFRISTKDTSEVRQYQSGVLAGLPVLEGLEDNLTSLFVLTEQVDRLASRPIEWDAPELERKILSLHLIYRETSEGLDQYQITANDLNEELLSATDKQKESNATLFQELQNAIIESLGPHQPHLTNLITNLLDHSS